MLEDYAAVARDMGVDAVALVPGPNFKRALGKGFGSNERPLVVVVPARGAAAAVVPNLELQSWALVDFPGATFYWRDQTGYAGAFAALADHLPLNSVAVEGQVMRVFVDIALRAAYPGLAILDGETEISALRIRKTADDVARLERAIAISQSALDQTLATIRPGQTERQVEAALIQALFARGAEGLSFPPIVAAATNSARPHASARDDYALKPGDALLIDFGARVGGFAADITRTFFIGHADDTQQQVYDTVLRANLAGHAIAAPGVTAHGIDDAVTSLLEASPFAARIRHKTGHGLGREVHEAPYIMRGNHAALPVGTVFTNEPGLYDIDSFGVRIEDDILITETGNRSLTSFPKDLTILTP